VLTAILQSSVHTLWHRCSGHRGAGLVWLHYLPHWKETPDTAAKNWVAFVPAPAIRIHYKLLSENHCHLRARLRSWRIFSKIVSAGGPRRDSARSSWVAWSGYRLSLGGHRYAINPARDLGRASRMPFFRLPGKVARIGLCPDSVIGPSSEACLRVLLRVLAVSDL